MRPRIFTCAVLALLTVTSAAQAARPVARWDVVPNQLIDSVFNVGVVAFHVEGVEVEFSVNGAAVHTATMPTYNPRTEVWEFWFPLDPSAYPDGPLTITARAVCLNDTPDNPPYDLPALTLYANSGGTLGSDVVTWVDAAAGSDSNPGTEAAPYATLAQAVKNTPAGGTVYLQAGTYDSQSLGGGSSRPYWTTIRPAPGVDRADVEIGRGRPGTQRLKWTNITLFADYEGGYYTILIGENGSHSVWVDRCYTYNKKGRWAASAITFGNRYVAYVTGGITTEMCNGPGGSIIRNHTLQSITSDAFTGGGRLVVNSECIDIDRGPTSAHPDFHQSYARAPDWVENVILYNVRGYACESQGLFGSRLRNSAFVNVLFERTDNTVMYSQYSGPIHNVMYLHINIINQSWLWRETDFDAVDVKVYNSIFGSMSLANGAVAGGLDVDSNHFSSTPMGTRVTTGDPGYLDPATRDYRLDPSSPAFQTGRILQCVPADIDGVAFEMLSPNRGCYAAANTPDAPGDIDGDGDVDLDDFVILKLNFGATDATRDQGDLDGDGDVDLDDFVILKTHFGAGV